MGMALQREACLIDGEWVSGDDWIIVDNPATGAVLGRVPKLGREETERAIAAAERAQPAWSALLAADRARILRRFHDLMIERIDDLAALLTAEQGKPIVEAKGEIRYAAAFIEWYAEEAKRIYGEVVPPHAADKRIIVLKQPIGVVAAITPWNFSAAMITRKIGPALAAGCTAIVKPASQTPFTALAIAALAEEAGIPAGVLNVVTGGAADIGGALLDSPAVRKLSFTGSTEVGAVLYARSAPTIKKLSLELGGNAPFIVFSDADIDAAVEGAIASKFRNAGQTCVCANRLYAQADIYDAFVARLAEAAAALRVGDGRAADTQIGPLIDAAAVAKVEEHVADALDKGGAIVTGGRRGPFGDRYYVPTVIRDVTQDMLVTREETFGPVAPVIRFERDEDVVAMANATPFGLAAYFYARDIGRIWKVAEAIEAGIVGVNTGLISTEVAPFGGVKLSGLGREGSRHGIEEYLEIKYVCLGF
ncbi:succinate semialdehyde dehydrogenase [Rhizorhabdus wittichii RW1]|uniref:Succinate semialdehyde dehydrogenase n=1 Tax=Rhizorhabdus wittichii (strain DSM 6014 / CCUG 31198 / JCM 15750 / NBRC 105917 / EY 4224 / RW1) TaxID=392499 RepID=A0A9J9HF16_RHIWR|nr:succinate semialdehyde dehydrogenase [Rhizorhabdus wittichii RW1]